MMKPKRKHLAEVVRNNGTHSAPSNLSNAAAVSDLSEEDSWVMVKKQRINILIPRLPGTEQSTMLDVEQGQPQGDVPSSSTNTTPHLPNENPPEVNLADTNDVSMSLDPETNTQSAQKASSPPDNVIAIAKSREVHLGKPKNEDRTYALRALPRNGKDVTFSESVAGHKSLQIFHQSALYGAGNLPSPTTVLSKMMRVSNLEKKIERAGGLSRWLSSLGLEQFVKIFLVRKVGKFQLANLSMQKLKDMGAHAVGPRRKLIHAIECLCEPSCFQGL